jgi:hypothetical protein
MKQSSDNRQVKTSNRQIFCPQLRGMNRQAIVRSVPAIVRFANGLLAPEHKANENLGETLIFRASDVTSGIISQKRHQAGTKLAPSWHQVGILRKCLKTMPRGLKTDIEKSIPEGISKNRPATSNSKWQNSSFVLQELMGFL